MHAAILLIVAIVSSCSAPWETLDEALSDVSPEVAKWASVVVVTDQGGDPQFAWHHYQDSGEAVNFWPASVIKVYTAVAALEYLNELEMDTDCALIFERYTDDRWVLDCARTMTEMLSEVFRRSSNEDYTLLLRFVGVDRLNSSFLIPERGFPHSALMRGYVLGRPYEYVRQEPQRITLRAPDGRSTVVEHSWSGVSYAQQRGATVISETTGNCTSTREMADCLRRIMFHEHLPPEERYRLTAAQLNLLRHGGGGLTGLQNRKAGPYAWTNAAELAFPDASYFHKAGLISNFSLDLAYVDDPATGVRFVLAVAAGTGQTKVITAVARRIALWIRDRQCRNDAPPPLPPTVEPGASLVELYADDRFFEGPVWDPGTARLYFTAFGKDNQQVLRLEDAGNVAVYLDRTEGINGMYLAADGRLLCAQAYGHRVLSYDVGAAGLTEQTILAEDKTWNQPNDVCQTSTGNIYFTDPDFGRRTTSGVYRLSPDGQVSKVIEDMAAPNGLIASRDGSVLYVADSFRKHWRSYPIRSGGSLGQGQVFFDPATEDRSDPDGMTIDADGNLYFTGRGGVWVVHSTGACLGLIPVPEFCSNVTFGGAEGSTLFLTCKGKLYSLAMRVRGAKFADGD